MCVFRQLANLVALLGASATPQASHDTWHYTKPNRVIINRILRYVFECRARLSRNLAEGTNYVLSIGGRSIQLGPKTFHPVDVSCSGKGGTSRPVSA